MNKLVVGPIQKGLRTGVTPFNVDNDSFPTLINAYQWRGRVKRKRGTTLLCRLKRFIGTTNGAGNLVVTILPIPIPVGISSFLIGTDIFTDPGGASPVALITNSSGTGTLDRTTGVLTITGSLINTSVFFFPTLPVMGLEDLVLNPNIDPGTMAFDTKYSYLIQQIFPYQSYDVSFYKNLSSATYPGYIQKGTWTPTTWNGQNYQQFWTVNYQGALWATNGVNVPFNITNIGMQFKLITNVAITAVGPPATADLTIVAHGLVIGDFLFINEVNSVTGINFQTGYVIAVPDANTVTVEFPNATLGGAYTNGGIAQYLTNRSDTTKDCIRWFDGDPTNGSATAPTFLLGKGWVNFMPPLSLSIYIYANLPEAQYYLVGAKMIVPFKDRLLFLGPVVQTSTGVPIYLQNGITYSLNGTAYYTSSFTGDPTLPTTVFTPILVPDNQTATPPAYFADQTGFGGVILDESNDTITTCSTNEDVLIIGFKTLQTRLVFSGNDLSPFNFYTVNTELGSTSTFSAINMDKGVITKGNRGYILTTQVGSQRIDLQIPDQIFQVPLSDNANERICAQRDYINEWMYFTYTSNETAPDDHSTYIFPNQTLFYNYRDDSFAIFNETYTTYGQFRKGSFITWATVGSSLTLPQWRSWNSPWNSGTSTVLQPDVIAGNQQGFVMVKDDRTVSATGEGTSLYIQNIVGNTVTSPFHCLNNTDFIVITGALGTVGASVNNQIFQVYDATSTTFKLNPIFTTGTYLGGGLITRMYVPFIQTRQFPLAWSDARKVRFGAQRYLLSRTPNGQITVNIYLSQNDQFPYNSGTVVPAITPENNSLIYSSIVCSCAEKFINGAINISIGSIGDGVTLTYNLNFITLFGLDGTYVPASITISIGNVATFTDTGQGTFTVTGTGVSAGSSIDYLTGKIVLVFSVAPLNQASIANFQYYTVNIINPIADSQDQIWHRMSTSLLGDTVQLGFTLSEEQMRDTFFDNQFAEIELHGFIVDVSPSGVLA